MHNEIIKHGDPAISRLRDQERCDQNPDHSKTYHCVLIPMTLGLLVVSVEVLQVCKKLMTIPYHRKVR